MQSNLSLPCMPKEIHHHGIGVNIFQNPSLCLLENGQIYPADAWLALINLTQAPSLMHILYLYIKWLLDEACISKFSIILLSLDSGFSRCRMPCFLVTHAWPNELNYLKIKWVFFFFLKIPTQLKVVNYVVLYCQYSIVQYP